MARTPSPWYRKSRNCWFVTINGRQHSLGSDKKTAFDRLMCSQRVAAKLIVAQHLDTFQFGDAGPVDWVLKASGHISPDIQEGIFLLPRTTKGRDAIKEADFRPIAKTLDWNKQWQMWRELKNKAVMES